jgi:predicted MFS family arabinose efflux permease
MTRSWGTRGRGTDLPRDTGVDHRLVAARNGLGLVFFSFGAVGASWASRLPLIQQQDQLSTQRLSLALLALPVGVIVATRCIAVLTRLLSAGHLLRLGIVAAPCVLVALGGTRSFAALAALLFLFGIGMGIWDVSMNTQGVVVQRGYGRSVLSGLHGAFSVGVVAGGLLGAAAAHANLAPTAHFAIAGAGFGCVALFGARGLPVENLAVGDEGVEAAPAPRAVEGRRLAILAIGLIVFCSFFTEGGVDNWSAVFLHHVRGASLGLAPLGASLCGVGMAVARFRGDAVISRAGPRKTLILGSLLAFVGMVIAATVPLIAVSLVGFIVFGVGAATLVPVAFTLAGEVGGARPSWAIARVAGFGYAGLIMSPAVIGQIAGRVGFVPAYLVSGALLLLIIPACLVVTRPRREADQAQPTAAAVR